jgi:hypothetical protein
MKTNFFSLLLLLILVKTTFSQDPQSFCFHVQLFEIGGNNNQIYEADNSVTCTNNGPEFQTRPIYTCETLLLLPIENLYPAQCGSVGTNYLFIEFFNLNNTLINTITITNSVSNSPPDCAFLFNINSLNLPTGMYNMIVHLNSQVAGIMSVGNIYIINNSTPQIIQSHTQTCNTQQVCFTFNTSMPNAFLAGFEISFGDGQTSPICTPGLGGSWNCTNTICHTYTSPGNYSVTLVPTNPPLPCPISAYPITVRAPLAVNISPNNYSGCATGTPFTITATASGGSAQYGYQWSVPAGDAAPFGISPLNTGTVTFTPSNAVAGTYRVTVTDANGCTATASFQNNAVPCCNGYNNLNAVKTTFNDVTTAWLSANFGFASNNILQVNALPSQMKVAFNGTLTVNTNFTILNSPNITFGPGARILVQPGFTLRIDNSTLKACDNFLWKGIETSAAGSTALGGANQYSVVVNNAVIQDALYGIECSGAGRYAVASSTFDRNYIGIIAQNLTNALSITTSCNYTSSSGILPSWAGAPAVVASNTNGYIGIYFSSNGTMVQTTGINGNTATGNNFSNLNCGILAVNSSVNSNYASFSLINNYQTAYFATGWCMYAFDVNPHPSAASTFTINMLGRGNGSTDPLLVNNVKNGFFANNVNFTVQQYRMDNVNLLPASPHTNTGIQANTCLRSAVNILNNSIANVFFGIRALNNTGANQQIIGNSITVADVFNAASPPNYTGITVGFVNRTDNFLTNVQNNTVINGRFGISLTNCGIGTWPSVFYTTDNSISMPSNSVYNTGPNADTNPFGNTFFNKDLHGIYLFNCLGAPSGYAITDAFRVSNNTITGPNANHRNYVAYRKAAITLDETQRVVIRCNTMNYTGIGLYVKGNCDLTTLSCNSYGINTTSNPGFQYSMLLRRTTVGGDGKMGQIGLTNQCFSNSFVPINYAGGFQAYRVNATAPPPGSQIFYDDNNAIGLPLLNITQNASNNAIPALSVSDASGTPLTCSCSAPAPMMAAGGGGSGSMMSMEQADEIIEGEVVAQFDPEFTDGGLWLKERELYKQLSENTDTLATDLELQNFYTEKQTESVGQVEELDSKLAYLSDESKAGDTEGYEAKKAELLTNNANIEGSRAFEANEKLMNELYLNRFLAGTDSLTSADTALVSNLAHQCPLLAGTAVYKARAIYNMWHAEAMFDDNSLCQGSYKKEKDIAEAVVVHQFSLLPNPAKEIAYLYYRMPWEETAEYSLYNTLGEVVASQSIDGSLQLVEIPTSKMATGIYFVRVQQGDLLLYAAKLSVTK